jgi:VanZ family protein
MVVYRSGSSSANKTATAWGNRLWRYVPLLTWMALIFIGSTDALSASHSELAVRPLLLWLFPRISEQQVAVIHFLVRKGGHLTEYAILAFLAARAFNGSAHEQLRRRWFAVAFSLVVFYAFSDEYHQSFVSSRTASVYDGLIDISGGLAALIFYFWRHATALRKLEHR